MALQNNIHPLIKILAFGLTVSVAHAADNSDQEWTVLFNGENLDGWEFRGKKGDNAPTFEVVDGAIVGSTVMPYNPTAFVCTTDQFGDFELIFETKVDKDLNSGVQIRSTPEGTVKGAQVELQNDSARTGYIYGQGMGMWLSDDLTTDKTAFKSDEWNTIRVVAKGKNIKTWVNGQPAADSTNDKIADTGVIGLQVHGYPRGKKREAGASEIVSAAWRNIKIRELTE